VSLRDARPVIPYHCSYPLPHRCLEAAGNGWALLPHTYAFYDPLFSTGIAWSLLAVERLADWGEALRDAAPPVARRILERYGRLVAREADHVEALLVAAWRAMRDFDRFVAHGWVYFAAASFAEARQRLCPERAPGGGWAWSGFLGARDRRIAAWARSPELGALEETDVLALIAARNIAGLGDPAYGRRVPVALDPLVAGARKLGLGRAQVRERASRLRGWTGNAAA
jgi:FADH2 O2-dependent halogenase